MKKVFLSFLTVLLFAGYGMAQNSSTEEMEATAPTSSNEIQVNLNSVVISDEERSHMETLKSTDVAAYKVYLKQQYDIAKMELQLQAYKEMDSAEKAELISKLNKLKAKHSF